MKKLVKCLLVAPLSLLTIVPVVSCSCGNNSDKTKDVIPTDKLKIDNGVLSGFVDGFDPTQYNTLSIPDTVTKISASAFENKFNGDSCKLKNILIPNTATTIESKAFANNTSVTKYDLSNFTTVEGFTWANDTFTGCAENGSIAYPQINGELNDEIDYLMIDSGLTINWFDLTKERIVEDKFLNIESNSILKGFNEAFYSTPHAQLFTKLSIPSSITQISDNAFYDEANSKTLIPNINNVCFNIDEETQTYLLQTIGKNVFRQSNIKSIDLKDGLEKIGDYAFADCTSVTQFAFPTTVENIGKGCFQNCQAITSLTINSLLKVMGEDAFRGCSNLKLIDVSAFETVPAWSIAFKDISEQGHIKCKPSIASDWKGYFTLCELVLDDDYWTITEKINILDGYESVVKPIGQATWNLDKIKSRYLSAINSKSQILVDDLYHTFYEWTKTIQEDDIELSKFEMLITNVSYISSFNSIAFSLTYDIEGTKDSDSFKASGEWGALLPFTITKAEKLSLTDPDRKYMVMSDDTLNTDDFWKIQIKETYSINGEAEQNIDVKLQQTNFPSDLTYDSVGVFMALNKFVEKTGDTIAYSVMSSYLQNITIG